MHYTRKIAKYELLPYFANCLSKQHEFSYGPGECYSQHPVHPKAPPMHASYSYTLSHYYTKDFIYFKISYKLRFWNLTLLHETFVTQNCGHKVKDHIHTLEPCSIQGHKLYVSTFKTKNYKSPHKTKATIVVMDICKYVHLMRTSKKI